MLQVIPAHVDPQVRGGGVVRLGDHLLGQGGLGPGQVPMLLLGLAEQRAEDGHLDHAGRVEVDRAVEPALQSPAGIIDAHRDGRHPAAQGPVDIVVQPGRERGMGRRPAADRPSCGVGRRGQQRHRDQSDQDRRDSRDQNAPAFHRHPSVPAGKPVNPRKDVPRICSARNKRPRGRSGFSGRRVPRTGPRAGWDSGTGSPRRPGAWGSPGYWSGAPPRPRPGRRAAAGRAPVARADPGGRPPR